MDTEGFILLLFFESAVSCVKKESTDLFVAWERELSASFHCVP